MLPDRPELETSLKIGLGIIAVYVLLAYILLPFGWRHYEHQRGLAGLTMVTQTSQGIPGDPINVGLVGSHDAVLCALHAASWFPADPVTWRSSVKIVGSVVLDRPYRDAPVSPLFFQNKREDLAFEKPAGKSADRRHHVRFWKVIEAGQEGQPVWLGAVTFDRGVGVSHYTGQVTHHIAADIDADRDLLIGDLTAGHVVRALYEVSGIGPTITGRNGGGDPYYTDGEIRIAQLVDGCGTTSPTVTELDNPPLVDLKNSAWKAISGLLQKGDPAPPR